MSQVVDPDVDRRDLAWQRVVVELRRTVASSTYEEWLRPLQLVSLDSRQLRVSAPSQTVAWVRDRFARAVGDAVEAALGTVVEVQVLDAASDSQRPEATAPSAHQHVRVPTQYLLHYPVERDPHACINWRSGGVRRWEHVGATVNIDHVSTPLHLRSVVAVASCLQAGIDEELRVILEPEEFARAAGIRSPGGRDVLDLLRVLEDWNASETLTVTLAVPKRARGVWGPTEPTVVISRPPVVAAQAVTSDGEILSLAEARRRQLPASAIALLVLDVDERFARLVATEDACRLIARETFANSRRAAVTYLRYQAVTPDKAGSRKRYAGWPWLQQLGMHGRVDPALENRDDAEVSRRARRTRRKAQRRSELFVHDDLQWLRSVDRDYGWVRLGDGGNGCAVLRVGIGSDPATGKRVYGPRPGADTLPHPPRRIWRRELVLRGEAPRGARAFAPVAGSSRRRRVTTAAVYAARRSPRPAERAPSRLREHRRPTGPAHDG
jgi:hypothetical protein